MLKVGVPAALSDGQRNPGITLPRTVDDAEAIGVVIEMLRKVESSST